MTASSRRSGSRVVAKLGATPLTVLADDAGEHLREVHVIHRANPA